MGQITVEKNVAGIEGLCVITPAVHGDNRGYFMETYSQRDMEENGIYINFVQDNQSMSVKGVLRGLHFQKNFPQTKLVRVIKGSVFDVAVDLRKDSKTFGKFCYKCDDFYHPNDEGGLAWNDPAIGIEWPDIAGSYQGSPSPEGYAMTDGTALCLSSKDMQWPCMDGYTIDR